MALVGPIVGMHQYIHTQSQQQLQNSFESSNIHNWLMAKDTNTRIKVLWSTLAIKRCKTYRQWFWVLDNVDDYIRYIDQWMTYNWLKYPYPLPKLQHNHEE
jgi:hypothetical protein